MVRSERCILGMEIIRPAKFSSMDPRETSVVVQQFAFMDTDGFLFLRSWSREECALVRVPLDIFGLRTYHVGQFYNRTEY